MRQFDLNIEEMLSHWKPEHATREFIANALDEQALSRSQEIQIEMLKGPAAKGCRIRDFGRGLRVEHFTMKENPEKLANPGLIGKFGVGLKDALATLYRNGMPIRIRSRYGVFSLATAPKHGFEEIRTLHVIEAEQDDRSMEGTEVIIEGVNAEQVERAKSMFLRFTGETVLEKTEYGEIIQARQGEHRVYVNGVFAAEEANFLFSYNVTSLTPAMRKHLSRERVNVGRTLYAERVKAILISAKDWAVRKMLAAQVRLQPADQCDEMKWAEVRRVAYEAFQAEQNVVFVTQQQLEQEQFLVNDARAGGREIVVIPDGDLRRFKVLTNLDDYRREYQQSFEFQFIDPRRLSPMEREMLNLSGEIMSWVGMQDRKIVVKVSETMRRDSHDTLGVLEQHENRIVVHRSVLKSVESFASTLLHELAHAASSAKDITKEFEDQLSTYLGILAARLRAGRAVKRAT